MRGLTPGWVNPRKKIFNVAEVQAQVDAIGHGVQVQSIETKNGIPYCLCVCPRHGEQRVQLSLLTKAGSQGCNKCASSARGAAAAIPDSEMLDRVRTKIDGKYIAHDLQVRGIHKYVRLTCPKHGEIFAHLKGIVNSGQGPCKPCGNELTGLKARRDVEDTKNRIRKLVRSDLVVGDIHYPTEGKPYVEIHCIEHGTDRPSVNSVLTGNSSGCQRCGAARAGRSIRVSHEEWMRRAAEVHGDTYQYHGIEYIDGRSYFDLECRTHGRFTSSTNSHIDRANGCKLCADMGNRSSDSEFLAKLYTIPSVISGKLRVLGINEARNSGGYAVAKFDCTVHGPFESTVKYITKSGDCPKCNTSSVSKLSEIVLRLLSDIGVQADSEVRLSASKRLWDIVIESHKLAIELDGLRWHGEEFDPAGLKTREKAREAESLGYAQINFFEDEVNHKTNIIKAMLTARLGLSRRVGARACRVTTVSKVDAQKFLETNHIQGFKSGSSYLGLELNSELVACMVFSNREAGRSGKVSEVSAVLDRYATSLSVVGGFQRLLAKFLEDNEKVKTIVTYSDPRLFTGKVYELAGFTPVHKLNSDYYYFKHKTRYNKRNRQKSWFKANGDYADGLTESELAELNGYTKIWDRGRITWKLDVIRSK
jgi:hypothetical protein